MEIIITVRDKAGEIKVTRYNGGLQEIDKLYDPPCDIEVIEPAIDDIERRIKDGKG